MLQMIADAYWDQGPWPHRLLVFKYVRAHSSSKGRPLCMSEPFGRQSPTANDVSNSNNDIENSLAGTNEGKHDDRHSTLNIKRVFCPNEYPYQIEEGNHWILWYA